MKISVIASSYPRYIGDGVAPFVKSISEALHKRGHHIEVVAPYDVEVNPEKTGSVMVHRFRYIWPKRFHIMGHARALRADVKLSPITLLLLPFYILAATLKLIKVSKDMKAEVIHNHWVLPNGVPAAITSKLLKIPFIISLHGSDIFMADKNFLFRGVARWVFSHASYVTACSQELFDRAKKIYPDINVQLLAWGADPDVFKPLTNRKKIREKYGWSEEKVVIITLGRFVYKKGFDRLLSIVPDLLRESENILVVIGGSGPLAGRFNSVVESLGINDYVSFPGQISWDEVPEFLGAADIFVLPSLRDEAGNLDGLPTVLLEAMACGLPCVASRVGGVELVYEHLNYDYLVSPDNNQALLEDVLSLLKEQKLRENLGQRSRELVENIFNWENVAIAFENNFKKSSIDHNNH